VLDAETRQPIQGAVVRGIWTKVAGVRGFTHRELVGVRVTATDAEGRFTLERLPSSGLDGEGDGQSILVYKFDYVVWSNLFFFPTMASRESQRVPRVILLERFPQSGSHRDHMEFIGLLDFPGTRDYEQVTIWGQALQRERDLARGERR
jgi:hypothetical protein